MCLQEVKCAGSTLYFNLKRLSNYHNWYSLVHEIGKGKTVARVANALASNIVKVFDSKSWVCVEVCIGDLSFMVIFVYAPCSPRERALVWNKLAALPVHAILCSDVLKIGILVMVMLLMGLKAMLGAG